MKKDPMKSDEKEATKKKTDQEACKKKTVTDRRLHGVRRPKTARSTKIASKTKGFKEPIGSMPINEQRSCRRQSRLTRTLQRTKEDTMRKPLVGNAHSDEIKRHK